ncbi:MAG: putative toxin-antitoxin system toxin component, PIN family [Candidatus Melainabacteria bacterium]|nr:putative toxin-antitoxin system toxin component, PIN family [Candidatus Melainabacteria bacterium]
MLKIVIDTNLCISALLNPGNPQRIVDLLTTDTFQAFYPALLLEQLQDVAARPKIAARISSERLAQLLAVIQRNAIQVMLETTPAICRDSTDDAFLECARLADCDYLVSGDKDLLILQNHGRTRIIAPAEFLQVLKVAIPKCLGQVD